MQTDAKVAPANYGGPLVDIQGRVQGILVPLSPQAEGETAGVEWYDSGIGFAIPLEDINAVLDRPQDRHRRQAFVLNRGLLGITVQNPDIYGPEPKVATVAPDSAAAKAGIKTNDVIKEIDGKPVHNQAQVLHALGAKYDGDVVSGQGAARQRGEDLQGRAASAACSTRHGQAVLGILPMRDDPELGVEVRYVYPKGPADAAGIKEGDRIVKVGTARWCRSASRPASILVNVATGTKVKVEVQRKTRRPRR